MAKDPLQNITPAMPDADAGATSPTPTKASGQTPAQNQRRRRNQGKEKRGWYYRLPFTKKQALWGVIFVLPWLIGFLAFFLRPVVELFVYSFQELTLQPGELVKTPVGWDNYRYILTRHASFNRLILTELAAAIPSMLLILFFSLIVAIVLNGKFRGRAAFRAIFFLPIIMATNTLGRTLGGAQAQMMQEAQGEALRGVGFLAGIVTEIFSPKVASALLTTVSSIFDVVLLSGVQTLIFLGGLQGISPALYEVAKIEGATTYETFWKVTMPMLSPLILVAAVYTLAEHFMRSSIVKLAYNTAFRDSNWGYSSAMSVLFLLSSVLMIALVSGIISRKVFYYD